MKLVVIIPALNEERTIGPVIRRIPRAMEGIDAVEVIVVDDGSSDRTTDAAGEAGARVISHQSNLGVGVALATGMDAALRGGADIIVNMSNDYWSLSPVEGRQHGLHALYRAVENRRPLVRATVSGYTVAVDTAGRILPGSPEPYTEGTLVAALTLPAGEITLYTRWGDWFPVLCLGGVAAAVVAGVLSRLYRRAGRREPSRMSPAPSSPPNTT